MRHPSSRQADRPGDVTVDWRIVRGRYFETMGIALMRGRLFSTDDRPGSPAVAIVDDVLARRLWTNEAAAIGRTVRFGSGPPAETRTIIGVVRHVSHVEPGKAIAASRLRAAVAGLSAWDVHRHQDHERATGGHVSGQGGAQVCRPGGADVLR